MRYLLLVLTTLGGILFATCSYPQPNDIHVEGRALIQNGQPIIPFGTMHVDPTQFPRLAELGFNTVHLGLAFWDFDPEKMDTMSEEEVRRALHLDFADAAHENGLTVLPLFSFHYTPGWLWERYPDVHLTGYDGSPGSAGWIKMCLDHPGFRKVTGQWLTFAASRLKDHPATLGYVLWNEPFLSAQYCYSPYTLAKFRAWLTRKYGDLAVLNSAWGTDYGSFEEAEAPPPRTATYTFETYDKAAEGQISAPEKQNDRDLPLADNSVAWTDWMHFRQDNYAEFFRWETETIRAADPQHPVTAKIVPFDLYSSHAYSAANNTGKFGFLDAMGFDVYSHLDEDFNNRWKADFLGQMAGDRPAWNTESNFTFTEQRGVGSVETWRTMVWQEIGRGINGFWFYHWAWNDSYALSFENGEPNPAGWELARLASKVKKLTPLVAQARPVRGQVAFLHSMATSFHNPGDYAPGADATTFLQALYRLHVPFDFVTEHDIRDGALGRYRLLCTIGTINIGDDLLQRIGQFVQSGGHVIANARFAEADDYGRPREVHPPRYFGVQATKFYRQSREEMGTLELRRQAINYKGKPLDVHVTQTMYSSRPMQIVAHSPRLGLPVGATLGTGRFYGNEDLQQAWTCQGRHEETWERLIPTTGRVVATFADGQPVIVETPRTLYVGRDTAWLSEEWITLVESLVRHAGVRQLAYARDPQGREMGDVDLAVMETDHERLLFVTRFPLTLVDDGLGARPDTPMRVYVGCRGRGEFRSPLADRGLHTRSVAGYRQTTLGLRPGDARVLVLEK